MTVTAKPLVVIGGWLGCQPRLLRKYIDLYETLGMKVLPVIAPPIAVVEATFQTGFSHFTEHGQETMSSMEDFANKLMRDIQIEKSQTILFHVFSNGGCFLWEHVRRAMDMTTRTSHDQKLQPFTSNDNLKSKIKGVIFDSCPAWFGDDKSVLSSALNHCTDEEKNGIRERFGSGVFYDEDHTQRERRICRNRDYFNFLREDPLDIPQLYLYCSNDQLSDCKTISDMVITRTRKCAGPILERQWPVSVHCAHLMKHPKDYAKQINDFVAIALRNSKL